MHQNASIFQEGSVIKSQAQSQQQKPQNKQSKIDLPLWLFITIMIMKTAICYSNVFYVYGPGYTYEDMYKKGYLGSAMLGLAFVVVLVALFYLHQRIQTLRYFFILDTITLGMLAAVVAFIGLMSFYQSRWYFSVLKAGFVIEVFSYSGLFRLMIIRMKWTKWRLISYKLMTFSNTMMFFILGTYFIYSNWSYTHHYLPAYDNKVKDFMILFMFGLFAWVWEIYKKITDFDFTADLRFIYLVKNVDKEVIQKKQKMIKNRRQSVQFLRRISQKNALQKQNQICGKSSIVRTKSPFAEIMNLRKKQENW